MNLTRRRFLEDSLITASLFVGGSAAAATGLATRRRRHRTGETIRVGVIGVRGRGRAHVKAINDSPDAEVVAICDADEGIIGDAMHAAPNATYHKNIRELLARDDVHAVTIATPNHWHALASVWALQSGKHVYVEKPISHDLLEGRILLDVARKSGLVVQHGTQSRSHRATVDGLAWLRDGGLGRVMTARGLCYKRRTSIGKVDAPIDPPSTCDYDHWTGPARKEPIRRANLHYDWHWDYNTGNGDIGNQGVHQMDIARWGLGKTTLPNTVTSCGGRLGYDDDGNTANTQIAVYDYDDAQLVFEVRGLRTPAYRDTTIGVIFHCEGGYLASASYSKVVAFDHDGNVLRVFEGGGNHMQDFLDAVDGHVAVGAHLLPPPLVSPRRGAHACIR